MKNKLKIVIGSDHGGFEYKKAVIKELQNDGYEVVDVGTNSKESCNYAEFAIKAANMVSLKVADYGVLICNSGEGVAIAANKVKNVRCGIGYNDEVSMLIKQHNNANMISFGAHFTSLEDVIKRIKIFLNTDFEGGRHEVRVQTITNYENK